MSMKIQDTVRVMRGKHKGKDGKIIEMSKDRSAVTLEDINMVVRNVRKSQGKPGSQVKKPAPIHASNVMLVCASCKKPTRVGMKIDDKTGKKTRVCKKCSTTL